MFEVLPRGPACQCQIYNPTVVKPAVNIPSTGLAHGPSLSSLSHLSLYRVPGACRCKAPRGTYRIGSSLEPAHLFHFQAPIPYTYTVPGTPHAMLATYEYRSLLATTLPIQQDR